jgi:formate hydrogenlyase subunit 4
MIDEGRTLEHSGPPLALFKHASAIKQLVLYTLLANVFLVPWGLSSTGTPVSLVVAVATLLAKALGIGLVVAVIDNSFAKLRLYKITEFCAAAFLLAVLAVFTLFLGAR